MVPAFDKVIFDPDTEMDKTYGPVETQFGFHLIMVHNRKMPETDEDKKDL